ncbi:MAG: prenyltransferase/squalene oxidase repeat-containing protein [Bryobacteraceae bacterium]
MASIAAWQNPDGGWPYHPGGPSWTEPTAYALLALQAGPARSDAVAGAVRWLRMAQRPDGGWPVQQGIEMSAWVTAVVLLAGAEVIGPEPYRRGIAWLVRGTGGGFGWGYRLRRIVLGSNQADTESGWPWTSGTAAWVTPTALSLLALRKAHRETPAPELQNRLQAGRAFLQQHACSDGGWNYGCPRVLNVDACSYPETTGAALLGLSGSDSPQVRAACLWGREQLSECRSSEGQSWLRLGLLAHGRLLPGPVPSWPHRTLQNAALGMLADAAQRGRNVFLD